MFYLFFQAQQITQQQSQQVHQLTEENVSIHSHQSVDEHYEEMLQYAETHKMYEEQRSTERSILMSFPLVKFSGEMAYLDYQICVTHLTNHKKNPYQIKSVSKKWLHICYCIQ